MMCLFLKCNQYCIQLSISEMHTQEKCYCQLMAMALPQSQPAVELDSQDPCLQST